MARRALSLRPAGLDALSMQAAPNLALNQALSQALMDFAAAPGRHALRLREPAILFDGLDTVALWALGRMPVGLAEPQPLRQAALLFVLRACFAPDLNHYQLLGLSPGFSAAQLRSRYRALIRLTHPDMGIEGLPAEAAGMVNRAHAVLGDGSQRAAYDRRLLTQLPTAAGAPKAKPHDTPHAKGQHKGPVRGHGPGRTGAAAGMGQRVAAGSRWAGLRHVVQAKGLRLVSLVGALSLGVLGLLVWATQGSGNEGRLVVTQRSANSSDSAPVKPETVALRVPA